MGTDRVGLPPPALDEDLGFQQGVDAVPIATRGAQRAVEGFHIAVLPGLPGSMKSVVTPTRVSQSRTAVAVNSGPLSERRSVGGPRSTKSGARRGQFVVAAPPPGDVAAAALPRVRVHAGQQPEGPPVCGPVADDGVGPDMVGALRPVAASARRPPARDGPAWGVSPAPVAPLGASVVPPACDGRASLLGAVRR